MNLPALISETMAIRNDKLLNGREYADVKVTKDIVYNDKLRKLCKLDIYRKPQDAPQPVFLYIHGGSFVALKKYNRRGFAAFLASLGFAVVNIDYGVAPKYKFPTQSRHAMLALKWIEDNAKEYNFDLTNAVVGGDSAGAYVAASVAALTTDGDYRKALDAADVSIKLKGAVLMCGIYDMQYCLSQKMLMNMQRRLGKLLMGIDVQKQNELNNYKYYNELSPLNFMTKKFPPTFVTHTDADIMCPKQGELLCKKFDDIGVPYWEVRASETPCAHVWNLFLATPEAIAANDALTEFLQTLLKEKIKNKTFYI